MRLRGPVAIVLLLSCAVASAQEPPAAPPPAEPPPAAPPPAEAQVVPLEAPPTPEDPWALYHQAFAQLAAGDVTGARATLATLVARHPGHPAALQGQEVLASLGDVKPGEGKRGAAPLRLAPSARAELAFYQTLNGAYVGVNLCLMMECDDGESVIGLSLLGAGVGLGASLYATDSSFSDGDRAAINAGTTWGIWNGVGFLIASEEADDGSDMSESDVGTVLLLADVVGTGAGIAVAAQADVKEGDVALATSVGMWSGLAGLFAHILFDDDAAFVRTTLLVSDVGFLAGIALSTQLDMSRARTLVIDAGGVLGGLVGVGLVFVGQENPDDETVAAGALAGMLVGLAGATYFSRGFDAEAAAPPVQVTVMPTAAGGVTAGVAMTW